MLLLKLAVLLRLLLLVQHVKAEVPLIGTVEKLKNAGFYVHDLGAAEALPPDPHYQCFPHHHVFEEEDSEVAKAMDSLLKDHCEKFGHRGKRADPLTLFVVGGTCLFIYLGTVVLLKMDINNLRTTVKELQASGAHIITSQEDVKKLLENVKYEDRVKIHKKVMSALFDEGKLDGYTLNKTSLPEDLLEKSNLVAATLADISQRLVINVKGCDGRTVHMDICYVGDMTAGRLVQISHVGKFSNEGALFRRYQLPHYIRTSSDELMPVDATSCFRAGGVHVCRQDAHQKCLPPTDMPHCRLLEKNATGTHFTDVVDFGDAHLIATKEQEYVITKNQRREQHKVPPSGTFVLMLHRNETVRIGSVFRKGSANETKRVFIQDTLLQDSLTYKDLVKNLKESKMPSDTDSHLWKWGVGTFAMVAVAVVVAIVAIIIVIVFCRCKDSSAANATVVNNFCLKDLPGVVLPN